MGYLFLANETLREGLYSIVSLREEDLLAVKEWRNSQMAVLRQDSPLTDDQQMYYYRSVVVPSFESFAPPLVLVSFLLDEKCIGYGGLVYIDWVSKRAEVSFLLETSRTFDVEAYAQDFSLYLTLVKRLAFNVLGLNRLFTETFEGRDAHEGVLIKQGFKSEGCLKQHVCIDGVFKDSHMHGLLKADAII